MSALLEAPVGIIEGAAGYGKSVLASELQHSLGIACAWVSLGAPDAHPDVLVASIRRALGAANLSDMFAALSGTELEQWPDRFIDALSASAEPLLIVLDDAHHLECGEAAALVARMAKVLRPPHRLVATARRLPASLTPLRQVDATCIDAYDLAFNENETAGLVRRILSREPLEDEVSSLLDATGGWASALLLALSGTSRRHSASQRRWTAPERHALIASLLDNILEQLSATERDGLCTLAHLPYVSPELAARLTGSNDMFDRVMAAGVPLLPTAPGLWEMPGPVTGYLSGLTPLPARAAWMAASVLRSDSQVMPALRMLIESGHLERAAAFLADLTPAEAEGLGWAEIRNLVEALPDSTVSLHPRILVHLARTAETPDRMAMRRACLARASEIVRTGSDAMAAIGREVQAEHARDLVWDERTRDEAGELAMSIVSSSGADEVARPRALDALGRLRSWWSKDGPHEDAQELLEESARAALLIGQPEWAARTLLPLAMGLYFGTCRYERALASIDRSLALLAARSPVRAFSLSFRATVLNELGRFAEAEAALSELRHLARTLGEEWIVAYAWWSEAELAALSGDRDRTERAIFEAHRHRSGWFDETPGIEFLSQTADMLDRVGRHDLACKQLDQARARMAGFERIVYVYEAAVLGRSGDPVLAEGAIASTLARHDLDPQERWPLRLLGAYAALRRGDPAATELACAAFENCSSSGSPMRPCVASERRVRRSYHWRPMRDVERPRFCSNLLRASR